VKLLLDENLSDRIVYRIIDLYPDSEHVKTLALTNTIQFEGGETESLLVLA
jgi:hypothetical protein